MIIVLYIYRVESSWNKIHPDINSKLQQHIEKERSSFKNDQLQISVASPAEASKSLAFTRRRKPSALSGDEGAWDQDDVRKNDMNN